MATTKFSVVLDMPFTAKQKNALNKDIQSLVKKHVAALDNGGFVLGSKRIPKEWLGIWLKRFANIERVKSSKTFVNTNF